ncbi:MAG: GDSL-type esterase/lipase family protein [Prevotella sp.]|nr:acetylxylan esterase AxeA1 [Prevotella sp.]MCI1472802.1 GDSL-type esterase/lipase family protein [Prevotella sp.]MCI1548563.1 GDSL-type esterase/lipase family protein [Prevotella sp.]MCI1595608.1 GDSL-type esterase/lipase family protein [Prevotella sp.]
MKKRNLLFGSFLLIALSLSAQTARKFTLNITADGTSTLTCYLADHPTGRAVVDCPGGGYVWLSMDSEGNDWAGYFNQKGISYFVLKYRMPKGNRQLPVSDAENAMRLVRDSASQWKINPYDVGIMGFSAGGHLASTVSTHADYAARPDFSLLFYPVITMGRGTHEGSKDNFLGPSPNAQLVKAYSNEKQVRAHLTPPAVIFLANDDDIVPPVENGVAYYTAMREAGNDCSLYIYPTGGHGFGFNPHFTYHEQVLNDLSEWLSTHPTPPMNAIRVACIGNSITDGAGIDMSSEKGYPACLQKDLGTGYLVKNFGVSGRTMLNRGDHPYMKELAWKDALAFDPEIVIIKLGTNDSKPENWRYGQDFRKDMQQMVDSLKSLPSHPTIYLATPIPAFKPSWNINDSVITKGIIPVIRKLGRKNHCKMLDLHTLFSPYASLMQQDGIHPTAQGAAQLAKIIAAGIKE